MLANLVYLAALLLVSPLIAYRSFRFGRYRRGLGQKLRGLSATEARQLTGGKPCLWIHAVSVGEVNLLPRFVHSLQRQYPGHQVVISASTDTGYDLAVKRFGEARVFFCPLDFSWAVGRSLRHLNPEKLILAELELWPNLIRLARRRGTEVIVINARLSDRSCRRYQRFGWLTRRIFANLDCVCCQDSHALENFAACGTPRQRMTITGSLKFDDAPNSRETVEVETCADWAGIAAWHRVWVVGSTQMGEEQMALQIYKALHQQYPELRLILVPRHKERFAETAGLVQRHGFRVRRRSTDPASTLEPWENDTVILVDTIGELRHWWGVAQIATVGGSFGSRGGQNMLEPAGYGAAVSFGPDTRNFQQIAQRLIDHGGAVRVHEQSELRRFVERCLNDPPAADAVGRAAREVVEQHRGANQRTIFAIAGQPPVLKAA